VKSRLLCCGEVVWFSRESKAAKPGEKAHESSGDHSETCAKFEADCQKPLAGAKVNFGFGKFFPQVKGVEVQVLTGEKHAGADIDKGSFTL
jgi:hypothetical protein